MVEKTPCKDLSYVLLGIIFLPLLIVIVISGLIPISDIESPSFLQLILSEFLLICVESHHALFILSVIVIGAILLWVGYLSNSANLRLLGVITLLGIPILFISLIYIGFMPLDPYFLKYTDAFMSEFIIIALFVAIGIITALLGKVVVGHYSNVCAIGRPSAQSQVGKVLGYGLFIWALWLAMGLGIMLDHINAQGHGAIITLFGITATKQEWFNNIFLLGMVSIAFPTLIIVGYIGRSYNLKLTHTVLILITALIIGSAIWDLVFAFLTPLPEGEFYYWFDPFGLGFLKGLSMLQELNVFKIESGMILMDTEFMKFFSYLRLGIFCPLLAIEVYKYSK